MLSLPLAFRAALRVSTKPVFASRIALLAPRVVALPRSYATVSTADGAAPKKAKAAPKKAVNAEGSKTAPKKKAAKKAAEKKAAPRKAKKKPTQKLKPWELIGEDGKKVPLPVHTKPKSRGAYLFYSAEQSVAHGSDPEVQKPSVKDGSPVLDVTKLSGLLSKKWTAMSDSEKAPYRAAAREHKKQYDADYKEWKESLTSQDIRRQHSFNIAQRRMGKNVTIRLRDEAKPKKPLSAFFRFLHEHRQNTPGSSTDRVSTLSEQWNNMSDDEKAPYRSRAAEELSIYQEELRVYKANLADSE